VVAMTAAVFGKGISCSLVKQANAYEEHVVSFFRIEDSLLVACSLFNDAVSNSDYISSNDIIIVNNERGMLFTEAFVAWCTVPSRHLFRDCQT
jgi:hypothetical protein